MQFLNQDKNTITAPIAFEAKRDGTLVRVAIQYTDSYTENVYSFVNNVPTGEGGTHETGFKAAVTKAFNDYARRTGVLKEKDNNLSGDDFREGMTAVIYAGVQQARSSRDRPRAGWATRRSSPLWRPSVWSSFPCIWTI